MNPSTITCPHCGAPPGSDCFDASGRHMPAPHAMRRQAASGRKRRRQYPPQGSKAHTMCVAISMHGPDLELIDAAAERAQLSRSAFLVACARYVKEHGIEVAP